MKKLFEKGMLIEISFPNPYLNFSFLRKLNRIPAIVLNYDYSTKYNKHIASIAFETKDKYGNFTGMLEINEIEFWKFTVTTDKQYPFGHPKKYIKEILKHNDIKRMYKHIYIKDLYVVSYKNNIFYKEYLNKDDTIPFKDRIVTLERGIMI